jgi:hypothetical protein
VGRRRERRGGRIAGRVWRGMEEQGNKGEEKRGRGWRRRENRRRRIRWKGRL